MLSVEATQNAPWGGSTRILTDDLLELCKRGYKVMVCGGTEKTLHHGRIAQVEIVECLIRPALKAFQV